MQKIEGEDQAKAAIRGFQHIIQFCKDNNLSCWGSLSVSTMGVGENNKKGHLETHTVHWMKNK